MVAIGLSAGAVARIRFAISGLWEVVAAVRVLRDAGDHAVHLPWVRRVRGPLAAAGLAGDGGGLLWQLVPAAPGYLPDFLTPPPQGLADDIDAELAALRATPAEVVRSDLELYPGRGGAVREMYARPQAGLRRLADEVTAFRRVALAADWSRIRLLLEADVFHRAQRLAEHGAAGLLNDLHERVRWEDDTLSVTQRYCSAADVPSGCGLVLIPSVFVWPSVLSVAATDAPQLAYPARGVATLWEPSRRSGDALAAVLGRGRARILAELGSPLSTTDLARLTGMTPGGVSQQLAVLRDAGLVSAHRNGRAVLNVRTGVAEALLSAAS